MSGGAGTGVVIMDKDGGRVVELDAQGNLPVFIVSGDARTFYRAPFVAHRYGAAGTDYFLNVNDSVVPAIGSGLDLTRYNKAFVLCQTSGDEATWDIVPLYGNAVLTAYTSGDKVDVSGSQTKLISVAGCSDFYVLCRGAAGTAGTTPGIKVWVAGYYE